ncbi:DUF1559 domain-containing protein [soil metagenome]
MKRRSAFTLIELLVVIAIIAILIGLLMPAVQKVREAGSRARCINNLKNIGLAVQSHSDKLGRLPSSYTNNSKMFGGKLHNWAVQLLPYMEQEALFNQYNFSQDWNNSVNNNAVAFDWALMHCPSSPQGIRSFNYAGVQRNAGDYGSVSLVPTTFYTFNSLTKPPQAHGAISSDAKVTVDDIRDGLSNTIAITEGAGKPQHYIRGRKLGPYPVSGMSGSSCGNNDIPATGLLEGSAWADPDSDLPPHGVNNGANPATSCPGPCIINCSNNNEIYSFHIRGVSALFCDGSVKFFREDLTPATLAALITRAGKEVLSDFE